MPRYGIGQNPRAKRGRKPRTAGFKPQPIVRIAPPSRPRPTPVRSTGAGRFGRLEVPGNAGRGGSGAGGLLHAAQAALEAVGLGGAAHPLRRLHSIERQAGGQWQDNQGRWHSGTQVPRLSNVRSNIEEYPFGGRLPSGPGKAILGAAERAGKGIATRAFRVGEHETVIPAARSRTGRAIERAADNMRNTPVTKTGVLRTTSARAGRETRYSIEHASRLRNTYAEALKKVGRKLNDPQEYALRVVAEGATPEARIAHHVQLAKTSSRPDSVVYHAIHADLTDQASKYIEIVDGRPVLRADAPAALHEAWDLFQKAGDYREHLLSDMGRLSDAGIAERIHAPARVIHGGRYRTFEQKVQEELAADPFRQQYFEAVDKQIPDPVQANAEKALFDAQVRSAAERTGKSVSEVLAHGSEVRTNVTRRAPWGRDTLEQPLFNKGSSETLDAAAVQTHMLIGTGMAPEEAAALTAKAFGVDTKAVLDHYQQHGQKLMDRILSNREVWKEGDPNYDAARAAATQEPPPVTQEDWFKEYTNRPGENLWQRGGSLSDISQRGVKGAIQFNPETQQAIIHLTEHADPTTFVHEMAHFVRRYGMKPSEEKRIAKWAGAKRLYEGPPGNTRHVGYEWTRAAEEKFAQGVEQYVRTGQGPTGLKQAIKSLSPAFRDIYENSDLPDVPPHVAQFFERMFKYEKPRGGRIFGAEDVRVGVAYAPTWRGMPVKITEPQRAMAAYLRRATSLFGGGSRRAIGAGPDDIALRKAFAGSSLLTGFFRRDVIGPKVEKAILANRMAAVPTARKALLEASSEIPQDVTDIAIKVDPSQNAPEELKAFWDKIASVENGGRKLSERDLNDINWDLVERARNDVFPSEIGGRHPTELAAEILDSQEPIDNIRWVPADFLEHSGLLTVPESRQVYASALLTQLKKGASMGGLTWDALNDFQKAMILWLNPAYVPMQLVGNTVMLAMDQGIFAAPNLWRAVMAHRTMSTLDRVTMDHIMGTGATTALQLRTGPGRALQSTLGHWANVAADMMPRRAAFLHYARKAGYTTKDGSLAKLLEDARQYVTHEGDWNAAQLSADAQAGKQAATDLELIQRSAARSIVNFDRMSPFERNVLSRWIFFYPWLRGATEYSANFIADHPIQALGLAFAADHLIAARQQQLGDVPYTASEDLPISTDSIGLKIPGTHIDASLSDLVGSHTMRTEGRPDVFSLRQAFTFMTPWELANSGIGFVTGRDPAAASDVVQHLTPVPYAAGVALYGYDPFRHKEVSQSLSTFFGQLSPADAPLTQRWQSLNMSKADRAKFNAKKLHPRTRGQDWMRLFGGSLAPSEYNTQVAEEQVLSHKHLVDKRVVEFTQDAKDAGLPKPTAKALEDLRWKTKLDQSIKKGQSWKERATIAAQLMDQRYHTHLMRSVNGLRTEGAAEELYHMIRPNLYRTYSAWDNEIQKRLHAKAMAQPAGAVAP